MCPQLSPARNQTQRRISIGRQRRVWPGSIQGRNENGCAWWRASFLIAIIAATIYYLASRQLKFLITRAVICGILYGLCVYLVMNFVVLPLSALPFKMPYPWPSVVGGLLIHMFGIGPPIALAVRWGSNT